MQRIELDSGNDVTILRKTKKKKSKDKKKHENNLISDGVDNTDINGKSEDGELKKAYCVPAVEN